jgi:hypothetical protein
VICSLVSITNLGAASTHVQRRYRISGMHLVHCNTIPSHVLQCSNGARWRNMNVSAVGTADGVGCCGGFPTWLAAGRTGA